MLFTLLFGLVSWWLSSAVGAGVVGGQFSVSPFEALVLGMKVGLTLGLAGGLFGGLAVLFEPRSVLLASRTPKEARSRSLIAALVFGLIGALLYGLAGGLIFSLGGGLHFGLIFGPAGGLVVGLGVGLTKGGWFLLLQKVAHRRLARAGNLPPRPYDFLEWGIERQIFRRVGGGVRFRHNLIQQHVANTSADAGE